MALTDPVDEAGSPSPAADRKAVWSRVIDRIGRALDGSCECALAGESVSLCSAEMIEAVAVERARRAAVKSAAKPAGHP